MCDTEILWSIPRMRKAYEGRLAELKAAQTEAEQDELYEQIIDAAVHDRSGGWIDDALHEEIDKTAWEIYCPGFKVIREAAQ